MSEAENKKPSKPEQECVDAKTQLVDWLESRDMRFGEDFSPRLYQCADKHIVKIKPENASVVRSALWSDRGGWPKALIVLQDELHEPSKYNPGKVFDDIFTFWVFKNYEGHAEILWCSSQTTNFVTEHHGSYMAHQNHDQDMLDLVKRLETAQESLASRIHRTVARLYGRVSF
ncbi:MAG: hypothetical protein M1609_07230 [Firmicutes bacterium]|nr:hypothetical protein [Bacillota bacterium]